MSCHICHTGLISEVPKYSRLARTTSDCKPWPSGGRIGVCQTCGVVQKCIDELWQSETKQIYAHYNIYHQSPTQQEQPIYIATEKAWLPRSEAVLTKFLNFSSLQKASGQAMDIGCGNGATLKAMAKILPHYLHYGFDPTATNIQALQSRRDLTVKAFSNKLEDLPQQYDLLTLIHVLEHIPNPLQILQDYALMLNEEGFFVIVVPNFLENPFDITIADHCSHFCVKTLTQLLEAADLEIGYLDTAYLPKEIIIFAKRAKKTTPTDYRGTESVIKRNENHLLQQVQWLGNIHQAVSEIVKKTNRFGVFGTSIAGNWMYGDWRDKISFFVDEDPDKIGTQYLGVPVLSMADLESEDEVYVALPPTIAKKIQERYSAEKCKIYTPPDLYPKDYREEKRYVYTHNR